jgi:hypothetical protein
MQQPLADAAFSGSGGAIQAWGLGQKMMVEAEFAILQALNRVRTNPKSLIPLIESKLRCLDESTGVLRVPGAPHPETSVEGAAAYREAIAFLSKVRPLVTLLDVPTGMLYAARDHVKDSERRMDVSPDGNDGSTAQTRLARYGRFGHFAHLMALNHRNADDIIVQLVVDDGVASRADRTAIFDPDMRVCGAAIGAHPLMQYVAVIILGHEYTDKQPHEQAATHRRLWEKSRA